MKKLLLTIVSLALLATACAHNETNPTAPQNEREQKNVAQETMQNETEQENNEQKTTQINKEDVNVGETIIWIEENETARKSPQKREKGIYYKNFSINEPVFSHFDEDGNAKYVSWDRQGGEIHPKSDSSKIRGNSIATRDEAVVVANRIFVSELAERKVFFDMTIEMMGLREVRHDSKENIWIFGYGYALSGDFVLLAPWLMFAIDGETSELIRMWID